MGDGRRRKWWVSGCLILSGVVVLLVATVAGLTWWSVRSTEPQSSTLVHELPDLDVAVPRADEPTIAGTPLQVLLELDSCEVYIEPAAPGEPLSVEAHYDMKGSGWYTSEYPSESRKQGWESEGKQANSQTADVAGTAEKASTAPTENAPAKTESKKAQEPAKKASAKNPYSGGNKKKAKSAK